MKTLIKWTDIYRFKFFDKTDKTLVVKSTKEGILPVLFNDGTDPAKIIKKRRYRKSPAKRKKKSLIDKSKMKPRLVKREEEEEDQQPLYVFVMQMFIILVALGKLMEKLTPIFINQIKFPYDVTREPEWTLEDYKIMQAYSADTSSALYATVVSKVPNACLTHPIGYDSTGAEPMFQFKTDFNKSVSDCQANNRYTVTLLVLKNDDDDSHANFLLYDKKFQTVERFEPYGLGAATQHDNGRMDSKLTKFFAHKHIKYSIMDNYGVQNHDNPDVPGCV